MEILSTSDLRLSSQLRGRRWVTKIVENRWDKTLSHPLHLAAYYLSPRYQYQVEVRDNPTLINAVHEVYSRLLPNSSGIAEFGNELTYFRDAKRSFSDRAAIASRNRMIPTKWWTMYGTSSPTVRELAIKMLSQTASSSACERNWSTFALIHTKQRNRLAYKKLQQLVFCYYNMKLKIRDMEAEADKIAETDYLDLLEIGADPGEEDNDPLYVWVRPTHLDDEQGNPDPKIASAAKAEGINVQRVLHEEVISSGSNDHSIDSFTRNMQATHYNLTTAEEEQLDLQQRGDNANDDDDADGDNDGSDGGNDGSDGGGGVEVRRNIGGRGEDEGERQELSPFTRESEFTHVTQDSDHGHRAGGEGIGAIGKPFVRRRHMDYDTQFDEDSLVSSMGAMSLNTDYGQGQCGYNSSSNYSYSSEDYYSSYSGDRQFVNTSVYTRGPLFYVSPDTPPLYYLHSSEHPHLDGA